MLYNCEVKIKLIFSGWLLVLIIGLSLHGHNVTAQRNLGEVVHLRRGDVTLPAHTPPGTTPDAPMSTKAGLYLVQLPGPVQEEWFTALTHAGLHIVQYIPDYAYLVWGSPAQLRTVQVSVPLLVYQTYHPQYALHPALDGIQADAQPGETVDVLVQVVDGLPEVVAKLQKEAVDVIRPTLPGVQTQVVGLRVAANQLAWLASQPGVVNVEPLPVIRKLDEVQAQIMAGALASGEHTPSGPGYLAWLTTLGFSNRPEDYPILDITDDGLDDGSLTPRHPDFYTQGDKTLPDRLIYNQNWTNDPLADGGAGHGNLNAGIALGYNDQTGAPYQDAQGYHLGLGINPFGRLGGSKVFNNSGNWQLPGDNYAALVSRSYLMGGRISSNSWGEPNPGSYTILDQAYDALARDAAPGQAGSQSLIFIFSAGNSGPASGSTGSPGNAKNVITVGASENVRPGWNDGCLVDSDGADDAQQIIGFSSRGPTNDGRIKPDLVAPGTHVQGPASQSLDYSGVGVCDTYYPPGQTWYAASSGTSHSAPAVAGAVSLFYRYYQDHFGRPAPSAAMTKAYLTNSARYLSGPADSLPSPQQGLGLADLGRMFDGAARVLFDQSEMLTDTGQVFTRTVRVADPALPLRVSLAWTDAPGATIGSAYVNDLNLALVLDGQTYLGNQFSGALSLPGGTPDPRNNLESIFLPPGSGGDVVVRITAANLPGDGVPGNADLTDQDFALVVYNAYAVTGHLTGQVTRAGDNAPVSSAWVGGQGQGHDFHTHVDASGAYTLPLPGGVYTSSVWAYGYAAQSLPGLVITDDMTVTLNFSLSPTPLADLEGCLSDSLTHAALEGEVNVIGPFDQWITQTLVTQSAPCYHFALPEGVYQIQADSRLHLPESAVVDLQVYQQQDFALQPITMNGVLTGQVRDAGTGAPVANPSLWIMPDAYSIFGDEQGRFEGEMPPLTYTLSVAAPFYATVTETLTIPQSNILHRDFALGLPAMVITPTLVSPTPGLTLTMAYGQSQTLTWNLVNHGEGPLMLSVYEAPTNFTLPAADGYGYVALDSRVNSGVRYAWEDVAGSQTQLPMTDDGAATLPLPFPFSLYGSQAQALRVSNNGAVLVTAAPVGVSFQNISLSATEQTYLLAPFWDDFDSSAGWVAYDVLGTAPNRRLVIEWFRRPHYYKTGQATFEMILYEATGNIKFQYQDVLFEDYKLDKGNSATVGIRGYGPFFNEFSYNTPVLSDGMALCYQKAGSPPCDPPDAPWLDVSLASDGPLGIGQQTVLQVQAAAPGILSPGVYNAEVHISSNDRRYQPALIIPVRLVINGYALFLSLIGH